MSQHKPDNDLSPSDLTLDDLDALAEQFANQDSRPKERVFTPPEERFPPIPQPFTTESEIKPVSRRSGGNRGHNAIALFFMLAAIAIAVYSVYIWQNPYSLLNPLAPATPFIIVSETPDPVALSIYFATQTTEAGNGNIPAPRVARNTPTALPANIIFPFTLVSGGVIYTPNATDNGCDWASISGSVTGLQGEPLDGLAVQITDAANPDQLSLKVFSGSAVTFGTGGFELVLGGAPLSGDYLVQLFSPVGAPLSEEYTVTTQDTCEENVAIINFVQIVSY